MKYKSLSSQATYQKDIGTFYGVNRTNRVNDYQMSDCKNMDTVSFPHFSTRGKRELFFEKYKMSAICGDTDIKDTYLVTGVTDSGGFVYRGEKVCEDGLDTNDNVVEFLGDYVFLPSRRVLNVSAVADAEKPYDVKMTSMPSGSEFSKGCSGSIASSTVNEWLGQCLCVTKDDIYHKYYRGTERSFEAFLDFAKNISVGSFFTLKMFAHVGDYGTYVSDEEMNPDYVCDIPDDVYMVVREVYGKDDSKDVPQGEISIACDEVHIKYEALNINGEPQNISLYFKGFTTKSDGVPTGVTECDGGVFECGAADRQLPSGPDYFNQCYIRPIGQVMTMGESFGGRLFACDNLGVDIYYTSGSMDADKKYDFSASSTGGGGFISCGDPGKWTALCAYGGALYAFKKNGMYRIYSPEGLAFYMERIADVGTFSDKSVCVVSDVMYFLSETGLYKFTGTYPEELPDNYGRKYTGGVLGGIDDKVYCSVMYADETEMIVYDAKTNTYGVHDAFSSGGFVSYGGRLYSLDADSGYVYELTDIKEPVEFSFDTRKFFLGFDKKAINGVRLYFDFSGGEGEFFEVWVSYDGGEFEKCFAPVTNGKLKYIPVKFKKCDEFVLRVQGCGVFTLKGMSLSMYGGGNIKQNK